MEVAVVPWASGSSLACARTRVQWHALEEPVVWGEVERLSTAHSCGRIGAQTRRIDAKRTYSDSCDRSSPVASKMHAGVVYVSPSKGRPP